MVESWEVWGNVFNLKIKKHLLFGSSTDTIFSIVSYQGGLVFVCGKVDGLMIISGRRHNMDDIIATVLAVEPLKFIYRGRYVVMCNALLHFSCCMTPCVKEIWVWIRFLSIMFINNVAEVVITGQWQQAISQEVFEWKSKYFIVDDKGWDLRLQPSGLKVEWMNHTTIICLHDRCRTKCHQFNFIHHLLPTHPTLV